MAKRYLLITHIPFLRQGDHILVDQLWANDLAELTKNVGPIVIAAPEYLNAQGYVNWGPLSIPLDPSIPISFVGFPPMQHFWEFWKVLKIRAILRKEVAKADLIHTSNLFHPNLGLLYGHFKAARLHKKTVFVIAEDFHDTLMWEWVRLSKNPFQYIIRSLVVKHMDWKMQRATAVASLSLFFTPAVVQKFRLSATNGIAVRDTTHSESDVISEDAFTLKCQEIASGIPLKLIAACRHSPLKGLEFAIRAIAILKSKEINVTAHLYGHGKDSSLLKTLAKDLNVSDRVFFPGLLPANREIYQAFGSHHLSLMPHRTNEFARAFYDSLAGGTPVLAFRTVASEGTVRDGIDGILTPLDNAAALALAIKKVHDERELLINLSKNARKRALLETKSFWHKFRADLIEELFKEPL